jgi:secreted trypsin-like serine protease
VIKLSIHVGEVKESEMGSKGQRMSVAEVIAHENYRGISNSFSNGIALLMLSSKAVTRMLCSKNLTR